jgi:hypothetical protein
VRHAISDSAMRPVVIVLLDPASDGSPSFHQSAILRRPNFFFFQGALEPFDVAVAVRVMLRRPPMHDAESPEGFQEPRRRELRSVVRRQRQVLLAAALGQPFEHGLLHRCERVFGPTAMRVPAHDLPRTAVDHTQPDTPNPPPGRPRSWSCPTARSDLARWLPRCSALSSVVLEDAEGAPTTRVRASPAGPVCDSHADLSSARDTTPKRSLPNPRMRIGMQKTATAIGAPLPTRFQTLYLATRRPLVKCPL